nr:type II toxin-antitoxin system PrlF family antitoxin [Acetobacter syzygii]
MLLASAGCILMGVCRGCGCGVGDRILADGKEIPYLGNMIRSRLTSKSQTTIPQAVRATLGLQPGDEIGYIVENGQVILTRVLATAEQDDPFATFGEWNSVADQQAYAGL